MSVSRQRDRTRTKRFKISVYYKAHQNRLNLCHNALIARAHALPKLLKLSLSRVSLNVVRILAV